MNEQQVEPTGAAAPGSLRPVRFGHYTLDLDGCVLSGPGGSQIALTRSEFAMLREFVRLSGRVLSRDHLLDVLAGRRSEPFDRSIDMLVARLRRKIEPDPKCPSIIVTVPGQGYKLAVPVTVAPTPDATSSASAEAPGDIPPCVHPARLESGRPPADRNRRLAIAAFVLVGVLAGAWWARPHHGQPVTPTVVTVLPFANLSGDTSQDYFGPGLAAELTTLLATFPTLRVVPVSSAEQGPARDLGITEAAQRTGARYVLGGGVQKDGNHIRVTAQLYEAAGATSVWAQHFDATGRDIIAMQADIADRIYQSIAGLRGVIQHNEEWATWQKTAPNLEEFDYYARGMALHMRLTQEGQLQAREIWRAGVAAFPNSALLRIKLAWTYLVSVTSEFSDNPAADIADAWALVTAATKTGPHSALATWYGHWITAFLYQWHDDDFVRSVAEARAAVTMAPYDAFSRNDLSTVMANAGRFQEAADWALWGIEHDPNAPDWYFTNLAFAYWGLGRHAEAVGLRQPGRDIFPIILAANYVRLGRMVEAREAVTAALKLNARDSVALEASFPLVEPYKSALLDDLRAAGLPEK